MKRQKLIGLVLGATALIVASCAQDNPVAPLGLSKMGSVVKAQSIGAPGSEQVASGQVTITKGMFYHQEPLVIDGENGQAVFQAVHLGHWDIYVELFNAQGTLIYAGAAEAVVKPKKTTEVMVAVTDDLGSVTPKPTPPGQGNPPENNTSTLIVKVDVPVPPIPEGLIFWNKLGNQEEVMNSMVGPGGIITGSPVYTSVFHGAGVGNLDSNSYATFTRAFGENAYSSTTLEFWVKWKPLPIRSNYYQLLASDIESGLSGKQFYFAIAQDPNGSRYYLNVQLVWSLNPLKDIAYMWWSQTPMIDEQVEHLAIAIDLTRPYGQKIRLFRDGVDMGVPDLAIIEDDPDNSFVFPTYFHPGWVTLWGMPDYIDNLKVWNYYKTDFSDRFTE